MEVCQKCLEICGIRVLPRLVVDDAYLTGRAFGEDAWARNREMTQILSVSVVGLQ